MMTVDEILDALGGYAKVAKDTGFPVTTVHSWKRNGFIPEWRRPKLLELAETRKIRIRKSDFPDSRAPSDTPKPTERAA